jgi:hypothetical protein
MAMVYVNINEKRPTWTSICSEKKQFKEKDRNNKYLSLHLHMFRKKQFKEKDRNNKYLSLQSDILLNYS